MGMCQFCGKPAGFLKSKHSACWDIYARENQQKSSESERLLQQTDAARKEIRALVAGLVEPSSDIGEIMGQIHAIATEFGITDNEQRDIIFRVMNGIVDGILDTQLVPDDVNRRMVQVINAIQPTRAEAFEPTIYPIMKLAKSHTLRRLTEGVLSPFFDRTSYGAINVQKGETIGWVFPETKLYEDRVHSHRVGGYSGISVRLHKGIYYHTGRVASHTVSNTETDYLDTGTAVFTDKKIYFVGRSKGLKLDFSKIIGFELCPDGIQILKDGTTAKSLYLITGDAWFTFNLATGIAGNF